MKVGESADRFPASKVILMGNSDALMTLVGEIIHGDSECYSDIMAKVMFNAGVPDTFLSSTIRSQSTLWIHQLKLFRTG